MVGFFIRLPVQGTSFHLGVAAVCIVVVVVVVVVVGHPDRGAAADVFVVVKAVSDHCFHDRQSSVESVHK